MGDRERRFEALYRDHAAAVVSYARRRTERDAALDVAAEVFTVAWRRLDRVPEPALPWLLGVAHRQLTNHHRSRRRGRSLVVRLAAERPGPVWPPASIPPWSPVIEALQALSADDRELLLLIGWDELTPSEAAQVLDISAEAARSRLHRARGRLEAAMRSQEEHR